MTNFFALAIFASGVATAAPPPGDRDGHVEQNDNDSELALPEGTADIDFLARAENGKFSFEFSKAEISDVVRAISNLTRQNFILPEKLKGQQLTILSPTKVTADEAYQVFLAALAVNGISVVRSGSFYKLMPAKQAARSPIPTCIGSEECPRFSDRMVTALWTLDHIDVGQATPVLNSLLSEHGSVIPFESGRALIVSEYAPNLTRVRRILDSLDVPGLDDELRVVKLEYALATEVADTLTQVFGQDGAAAPRRASGDQKRGRAAPAAVDISKIVADDRTNSLIIKASRRSFEPIRSMVDVLDVPVDTPGGIEVIFLEHADATELAADLTSLASASSAATARAPRGNTAIGPSQQASVQFTGEVKITANAATNALLVLANRHDFESVRTLVEKLDVARRKVFVEVAILEVTVADDSEVGVSWHAPMTATENDLGGLGSAIGSVTGGIVSGDLASPEGLLTAAGGGIIGLFGESQTIEVGGENVTVPSFGVLLKALEQSSFTSILATPHLVTLDNEEATLEVGDKVPFQSGTSLPTSLAATSGTDYSALASSLYSSVDRIDVSLTLTITPHVNVNDEVRLETEVKVEDVVSIDAQTGTPQTSIRSSKNVVVVDNQETVVIGGLMREKVNDVESRVPFLGDLPVIGWLFRQKTEESTKVNLLVMLTPTVIHDRGDYRRILERKMREHEAFAADYYAHLPEYRAGIDFKRKCGPLARLAQTVKQQSSRIENGGAGGGDEELIEPDSPNVRAGLR